MFVDPDRFGEFYQQGFKETDTWWFIQKRGSHCIVNPQKNGSILNAARKPVFVVSDTTFATGIQDDEEKSSSKWVIKSQQYLEQHSPAWEWTGRSIQYTVNPDADLRDQLLVIQQIVEKISPDGTPEKFDGLIMCYWTGGGLPDTLEDYPPEEDFAIPPAEVWNHAREFKLYTAKLPPHTFMFVGVGKASRWGLSECFDRAAKPIMEMIAENGHPTYTGLSLIHI